MCMHVDCRTFMSFLAIRLTWHDDMCINAAAKKSFDPGAILIVHHDMSISVQDFLQLS